MVLCFYERKTHRLQWHVGQTSVVRASTHVQGEFCLRLFCQYGIKKDHFCRGSLTFMAGSSKHGKAFRAKVDANCVYLEVSFVYLEVSFSVKIILQIAKTQSIQER